MLEFDLYTNEKRPLVGLYVRKGAGLPDLADASDWTRSGTVGASELPPTTVKEIDTNGHAFQDLADG